MITPQETFSFVKIWAKNRNEIVSEEGMFFVRILMKFPSDWKCWRWNVEISKSCGVKIVNGEKCSPKKFRQNHDAHGEQLRGFQACDCDLHAWDRCPEVEMGRQPKWHQRKFQCHQLVSKGKDFPSIVERFSYVFQIFICFPNFHIETASMLFDRRLAPRYFRNIWINRRLPPRYFRNIWINLRLALLIFLKHLKWLEQCIWFLGMVSKTICHEIVKVFLNVKDYVLEIYNFSASLKFETS